MVHKSNFSSILSPTSQLQLFLLNYPTPAMAEIGPAQPQLVNWSSQARSFDTHIDILYDILCQIAYVIKCQKLPFYGIF